MSLLCPIELKRDKSTINPSITFNGFSCYTRDLRIECMYVHNTIAYAHVQMSDNLCKTARRCWERVYRRMAKSGFHGGGAAGPAIDRVKSTTSHYSTTRTPFATLPPPTLYPAYHRPARSPPFFHPPDSTIHPRARCIIVRPHRLAPTSSTCPEQASALPHSHMHIRRHTQTRRCTRMSRAYLEICEREHYRPRRMCRVGV